MTAANETVTAPGAAETLAWRMRQTDLPPPPLPEALAKRLDELAPWVFATRPLPARPYDIGVFVREALETPPADYAVFAHDGHGMNSVALHLFLVRGGLAVFLQIPWGGAFMDGEETDLAVREAFAAVGRVSEMRPRQGERIVLVDRIGGSSAIVLGEGEDAPRALHADVPFPQMVSALVSEGHLVEAAPSTLLRC